MKIYDSQPMTGRSPEAYLARSPCRVVLTGDETVAQRARAMGLEAHHCPMLVPSSQYWFMDAKEPVRCPFCPVMLGVLQ